MADLIRPGARFGAYDILEELGSGGMGKVYRGRDRALERIVAIKILSARYSADEAFIQRFLTEARSAARLNHPNIVQVYDLGLCGKTYYIAMEFVDGESLASRLSRAGRFGEAEAVSFVRQACMALAAAHAERIVHRDVKPDNMMLTRKGVLKLVDMGLAKRGAEDPSVTQEGFCVGTPDYIAPEQIRAVKDIDGRADIYSLGASLFHLVTGRTPFGGGPSPVIVSRHLSDPLPDPRQFVPSLSEGLWRVLQRMMEKDRERRYQSCAEVEYDLARLVGDRPASSYMSPPLSAAPLRAVPTPRPAPAFDAAVLKSLEKELARHIGPLAKVLVRRAANQGGSLAELTSRLSENVPDGPARKEFETAARKLA